jgi:glycyl-tRNA synthetase beta chain
LKDTFQTALEIFYSQRRVHQWEQRVPFVYADLMTFIVERLKVHLREQGVRHDLIAAGFGQAGTAESDIVRLLARVTALQAFLDTDDGASLLVAYGRASNIVAIEGRKDNSSYQEPVDSTLLLLAEERALLVQLEEVGRRAVTFLNEERFEQAMAELAQLRQPVDAFFDKVTVNASDAKLRENRLRLLARIRDTMNKVADFSQIEG